MSSIKPARGNSIRNETRRFCPAHTVDICAPIETIWALIEDFDAWESWNPLYVESDGSFVVGGMLDFAVALPGMKPQKGRATVITVQSRELLEYRMTSLGGLARATRFIEIRQSGPGLYSVTNGEIMGGLLGPVFFALFGKRVRQGLQGMNEVLRQLAEQHRPELEEGGHE